RRRWHSLRKSVVTRGRRLLGEVRRAIDPHLLRGAREAAVGPLDSGDGASCPGDEIPQPRPDAWFHAGTAFAILPVSVGFQPGTFGNVRLSTQTVAGTCPAQTLPACQSGGAASTDVRRRPSPTACDRQTRKYDLHHNLIRRLLIAVQASP